MKRVRQESLHRKGHSSWSNNAIAQMRVNLYDKILGFILPKYATSDAYQRFWLLQNLREMDESVWDIFYIRLSSYKNRDYHFIIKIRYYGCLISSMEAPLTWKAIWWCCMIYQGFIHLQDAVYITLRNVRGSDARLRSILGIHVPTKRWTIIKDRPMIGKISTNRRRSRDCVTF